MEIKQLLGTWVSAENALKEAAGKEKERAHEVQRTLAALEVAAVDARNAVDAYMKEHGLIEDVIKSGSIDYRISYSAPRLSVKVDDAAVPDAFCSVVRKPKLKEIGDFLKSGGQANWARFEAGESKIQWSVVKK